MKFLVIGGNAAGMSAASRVKRKSPDTEVVVLEQTHEVSYGACGLPYYVAGLNNNLDLMRIRKADQFLASGVDLRLGCDVTDADFTAKTVSYTDENYEASRNAYLANLSSLKAELENELANGSFSTPARQNAYNVVKSKYYKDSSLIISEMADILLEKVYPAAAFVDENGKEIESFLYEGETIVAQVITLWA